MPKTIITFLEIEKWEQKYIQEKFAKNKNLQLIFFKQELKPSLLEKIKKSTILVPFIYSQITKEVITQLPRLKYITTMSTGYDHIDCQFTKERNIKVSNVPYYGENTVAEHTMALLLAISRKIIQANAKVDSGSFNPEGLMGFDLKGKTIGLIGFGHIGQHVARMADGFEMKVIICDPKPNKVLMKKLNYRFVSLEYLVKNSDVISLHAPLNKATKDLVSIDLVKKMKKGAVLLNTARGGLVDTDALLFGLNKKIIAFAGLDVLEEEGFIKEEKELLSNNFKSKSDLRTVLQGHLLINDPRVLITPHSAFNSCEALERILDTTVENILAFIQGKHINKV